MRGFLFKQHRQIANCLRRSFVTKVTEKAAFITYYKDEYKMGKKLRLPGSYSAPCRGSVLQAVDSALTHVKK
jgi:hypothetical protein